LPVNDIGAAVGLTDGIDGSCRACCQGRQAKVTTPINSMIAATLPKPTHARRDAIAGLADDLVGEAAQLGNFCAA
jgi:hypothetical protein